MSLEKLAEQDGREVWLAVLSEPDDAAQWAPLARPRAGVLAFLDGWDGDRLESFARAMKSFAPYEVAFGGESAPEAADALKSAAPELASSARAEEALDESVWYMFYASYEPVGASDRQPPLIVAFLQDDPQIEEFRSLCARFAEAMNAVLERE